MTVFLAYFDTDRADIEGIETAARTCRLRDGLYLVETNETRSKAYHRIKRYLAPDAALLMAPLADAPKFKGMEPGALKWVRAVFE
jgi:hypothetical protein